MILRARTIRKNIQRLGNKTHPFNRMSKGHSGIV